MRAEVDVPESWNHPLCPGRQNGGATFPHQAAEAEVTPVDSFCPNPSIAVPAGDQAGREAWAVGLLLLPQIQTFTKPTAFLLFLLLHSQPSIPVRYPTVPRPNHPPAKRPPSLLPSNQPLNRFLPSASAIFLWYPCLHCLLLHRLLLPSFQFILFWEVEGKKRTMTPPSKDPKK